MLVRRFYDDRLAQASYLIGCQRLGEAIVIDPPRDVGPIIAAARAEGMRITRVTETHIHADFVSGARELAAATGAEVLAVSVVPRYPRSWFEGGLALDEAEIARIERQWTARGQALADEVGKAAGKAGVKARAITVRSDLVAEAILATARKTRCDLVVMASHGRKGLKRLLLGSETQHVLTHGNIPVLVLR